MWWILSYLYSAFPCNASPTSYCQWLQFLHTVLLPLGWPVELLDPNLQRDLDRPGGRLESAASSCRSRGYLAAFMTGGNLGKMHSKLFFRWLDVIIFMSSTALGFELDERMKLCVQIARLFSFYKRQLMRVLIKTRHIMPTFPLKTSPLSFCLFPIRENVPIS